MSTINPELIDVTKPTQGDALTSDVRANESATKTNFTAAKADIEALEPHPGRTDNPHSVTAAQAGAEPSGSIAGHDLSGTAHGSVESNYAAHAAAANPHSGSASSTDLSNHKAGGTGEHPQFTDSVDGFVPLSGGGEANFLRADGVWAEPPGSVGSLSYTFSTQTDTSVDPGNGRNRANNALWSSVTQLSFDDLDRNGLDVRGFLLGATDGAHVILRQDSDGTKSAEFTINGAPVGQTGFIQMNVVYVSDGGGGMINNNANCALWFGTGGGGVGEANDGANVGGAAGELYRDKTSTTLNFKTLRSSDASVSITNEADTVDLVATGAGGGQSNTSTTPATVGAGDADINMAKNGVDLPKKKLTGGTDIDLTDGADAITIAVDTVLSTHPSLTNNPHAVTHGQTSPVADEHVAHSGVTMTAGSGLTGGGTIAATRTFNVGAGDGVSVAADAVAVDATVQRRITGGSNGNLVSRDVNGDVQDAGVASSSFIPATLTTDGDFLSFNGSAHSRIGVGTDGQVLTARPGAGAGSKLAWETPAAGGSGDMLAPGTMGSGYLYVSTADGTGEQTADGGVLLSSVARLDQASDFTVSLAENGVGVVHHADNAVGTTVNPALSVGNSPRYVAAGAGGAVTLNAPTGEGEASIIFDNTTSVSLGGVWTQLNNAPSPFNSTLMAYIARSSGGTNYISWVNGATA